MDYFSQSKYLELQGLDMRNPLQDLRAFYKKIGSRSFNENHFASHMKLSLQATRQLLLELAFKGFVNYSLETGEVYVTDKTFFLS